LEQAIWIVHGDAQARTALARMAALPALAGPPRLEAFPPAPAPGAVVLHVPLAANDALAFAHAAAARHPRAQWLLLADPGLDPGWLLAAFAGLRASVLLWPVEPAALRQALRRALAGGAPSIGARRQRDALVARFARSLGDLAIPDPVLDASGHLAISGERGVGKLLLARTLHALWDEGDEGRAGFVLLARDPSADAARLEARIAEAAERRERLALCVDDPAALATGVQRELASWVELGPPGAEVDPTRLLWIFLRPESFGAVAPLEDALAELCEAPAIRIPPLRERSGAALQLAEQWLREWAAAKAEAARELAPSAREAIARDPWPGNVRELEAALRRAVAQPGSGPIEAGALALAGGAPRDAAAEQRPNTTPAQAPGERAREFATLSDELDAARRDAAEDVGEAAAREAFAPASAPRADLRAFARAAARDLRPALRSADASTEPSAARMARRVARFERFAEIEPSAAKLADLAVVLASLLEERRAELLAKRLLVLRELEPRDAGVRCDEPTLRFALGAALDTLLEAAPSRSDLYVSARPVAAGAGSRLRVELRLRDARISDTALDLLLARELLAQLGAILSVDASAPEARVVIELGR
jgi:DNA-binding NtrC family response regulator